MATLGAGAVVGLDGTVGAHILTKIERLRSICSLSADNSSALNPNRSASCRSLTSNAVEEISALPKSSNVTGACMGVLTLASESRCKSPAQQKAATQYV